ncbi:MAG: cache domain-containing protein, partial [Oscillospiraceae bacterium]|nr:cache domain-containing protein [Oscillospiraceae bacterium]
MSKKKSVVRSNFARRINLYYFILIAVLLVLFGIISYALMRMNISSNTVQTMNNTGSLISELLDDHIRNSSDELLAVANNELIDDYIISLNTSENTSAVEHKDEIVELLSGLVNENSDIVSAWIISEQKGILTGSTGEIISSESYGLEETSWYQNYISGRLHSSEYICPKTEISLLY